MTLLKSKIARLKFMGADGRFHAIRSCPLTQRQDLKDWYDLLFEAIANADQSLSFMALYDSDDSIQELCHEILQCCGISPSWVGIDQMVELIYPREVDGALVPGLLYELNGFWNPEAEGEPQEADGGLDNYKAILCGALINQGFAHDLAGALAMMATTPLDELEAVIFAKVNAEKKQADEGMSHKDKLKSAIEKKKQEYFDRELQKIKELGKEAIFAGYSNLMRS